jgi:FKBP-type peptidyl-prolyl cis-trans isomerase
LLSLTLLRLRCAVPPELGYGKLQVQEIPPVRV